MKWMCLLLFGTIGLTCFIAGIIWGARRFALWRDGVRTTGLVVDIYESHSSSTENGRTYTTTSYYPVAEFTAQDGKTYRFKGSTGSSAQEYEKGSRVNVLYNRADPSVAQIGDFEQFWLGPLCVGIFGFLFLAGGIGGFFLIKDSDRTFGPEFRQKMARAELFDLKKGIKLEGVVRLIRPQDGGDGLRYTVVCSGGAAGGAPREFVSAPLSFDPGPGIIGKKVDIYADPEDPSRYYVRLDPLFGTGTDR